MYPVLYTNTEQELKKRIRVVNKNINILSRNNYWKQTHEHLLVRFFFNFHMLVVISIGYWQWLFASCWTWNHLHEDKCSRIQKQCNFHVQGLDWLNSDRCCLTRLWITILSYPKCICHPNPCDKLVIHNNPQICHRQTEMDSSAYDGCCGLNNNIQKSDQKWIQLGWNCHSTLYMACL